MGGQIIIKPQIFSFSLHPWTLSPSFLPLLLNEYNRKEEYLPKCEMVCMETPCIR